MDEISPLKRKKMLVGIIVILVIVIGFLGYYILQTGGGGPTEVTPITSASEAQERISALQNQLEGMADDLKDISESL